MPFHAPYVLSFLSFSASLFCMLFVLLKCCPSRSSFSFFFFFACLVRCGQYVMEMPHCQAVVPRRLYGRRHARLGRLRVGPEIPVMGGRTSLRGASAAHNRPHRGYRGRDRGRGAVILLFFLFSFLISSNRDLESPFQCSSKVP